MQEMKEMWVQSLDQEDSPDEEMAIHSSILAWRRKWQSTPVFLPGESHGWRTLVGCSPWGRKESDFCAKSRKKRLNSLTQFQLVTFEMLSHQVWPVAARLDLASVLVIA